MRLKMTPHFTEATIGHWQRIVAADAVERPEPPWQFGYPARLPDGRVLMLPIRQLAGEPAHAVASLLVNHASLEVVDTLGAMLAQRLAPQAPELVIGLPTLGLTLAPVVARALGHARYLPLVLTGVSSGMTRRCPRRCIRSPRRRRASASTSTPTCARLIQGRRLVLVDDAVSTGTTLLAAWDLIESLGGEVVACGVAMLQGRRWVREAPGQRAARVVGVFESPLLEIPCPTVGCCATDQTAARASASRTTRRSNASSATLRHLRIGRGALRHPPLDHGHAAGVLALAFGHQVGRPEAHPFGRHQRCGRRRVVERHRQGARRARDAHIAEQQVGQHLGPVGADGAQAPRRRPRARAPACRHRGRPCTAPRPASSTALIDSGSTAALNSAAAV